MRRHHDTIAALATAPGTAAIAIMRVSGPDTAKIAQGIHPGPLTPRRARHVDYRGGSGGAVLDDVVLTFFQGPQSYTGEDSLEISCHGNPFIAQKILEDLVSRGCRLAEPGEFTQRAFLNGKMDLSQAEAVMDLIHARSERAIEAANRQLRGALARRMTELVDKLLGVLAQIEAYIDFPDEDLPAENRRSLIDQVRHLSLVTNGLIATSRYGHLLRDGIRTVIVGAPNAGKSSLLNQLVGSERALVSAEPGTTRDFIEERILVGPHALRLIDTAGFNPSPAPLEKLGIEKSRERVEEADLVLHVIDSSHASSAAPPPFVTNLRAGTPVVTVLNKSDLSDASALALPPGECIRVSALTGDGVEELRALIARIADSFATDVTDGVAVSARHAEALTQARQLLLRAEEKLERNAPTELLASDLRGVLNAYGEITGRIDNERMLDQLFATFCIGK